MTDADLARIYQAYHGRVVAYAARLLGRDDAEDLAQEVFVKIGRSLETLADESKLTPWIYSITLNAVRDAARRRASHPVRPAAGAQPDAGPAPDVPDTAQRTVEESMIRSEMISCYLDYVNRLPSRHHEVYVLSQFAGLSNEAIAERLGVSIGAVKIRLHRARATLHRALRQHCRCYVNDRGELMGEPKGD
jgi:RNA polymerase sigma-70 factor (ECF subfamily)